MAWLRVYGDPQSCRSAEERLSLCGANIEIDSPALSEEVYRKALSYTSLSQSVDPELTAQASNKDELAQLLARYPERIFTPLIVRGSSCMLGTDPARVQSLMY